METGFFTARDNTRLFFRRSANRTGPKILMLHGSMEHSVNYPSIIEKIFPDGADWAIFDFRGHGKSEGKKNEIFPDLYQRDVEDFISFLEWERGSFSGITHSFGALLAVGLLQSEPHFFKSLILSSPFFGFHECHSTLKVVSIWLSSFLIPGFQMRKAIPFRKLTHDEERVRQYESDPLIINTLIFASLRRILNLQRRVMTGKAADIPILLLQGDEDQIVSQKVMERWFAEKGGPRKRIEVFHGYYHEVFHELENSHVFDVSRRFLQE